MESYKTVNESASVTMEQQGQVKALWHLYLAQNELMLWAWHYDTIENVPFGSAQSLRDQSLPKKHTGFKQ